MRTNITNLIKYILQNYPHKSELSVSRLTKMIYLADWKSAIENNNQLTDIRWHFNHYGPYVEDILKIAKKDEYISVKNTTTLFGGKKTQIELSENFSEEIFLAEEYKKIADFVIDATKDKNYQEFIKLVYSTFPVLSSDKYSDLDLVKMASEYKKLSSSV